MDKPERTVDAVSQVCELLGVVQDFDALGVRVVADWKRPGDGGRKFPVDEDENLLSVCAPELQNYL